MRPCVVIPFYNHEQAIAAVIGRVKAQGLPCILVDDGSDARCQALLGTIAAAEKAWLTLLPLPVNSGKGAAVMAGFEAALAAGYTHGIQLDADAQHCVGDLPRFIAALNAAPTAVIAGLPIFDASIPRHRLYGRYATHVWVWINTLSLAIADSMCGFRAYPLAPAVAVWQQMRWGRRMDFDTEIIVRLYWAGLPIVNLPTRVSYPSDGVSHFRLWHDNLRITAMHTRLFFGMLWRLPRLLARTLRPH